jgi:hypothetical protein
MFDQNFRLPSDALSVQPPLIRLGTTEDVAGVNLLESRYFVGNLTPAQRGNGFISMIQPEGWFARIAEGGGLHVAVDGSGAVVGFIAIAPPLRMAQAPLPPIVEQMVMLADTVEYRGRRISSYKYALRGPVCIDERFRGAGLYDSFNAATKAAYSHVYDIGVLFVSARNPRSLRTTTTKLKATPLATFNIGGESYDYLAYEFGDSEAIAPN